MVADYLRQQIVSGTLPPGSQLPSRRQITQGLGSCVATVHRALEELERDGFVESVQGQGTFVTENPPHLSRYAIVLGSDPYGFYSPFTAALRRHIGDIEKERSCHFVLHENMTGHSDTFEYQELLRDIQSHRLAGLIFSDHACGPSLPGTPFMTIPGIPRVLFTGDPQKPPRCPGVASIYNDDHAFLDRALDHLLERGRHRVAFLAGVESTKTEDNTTDFLLRVERRGMTARRRWVLGLSLEAVPRVTELLLSLPPGERPDGLVLMLESLIKPVGAGIAASGAGPGRDLDVVAYCNLPGKGPAPFPMRRLGVDVRERLRICLDLLDRQRRGESVPQSVLLQPVFEEELARSVVT